MNSIYMLSFVFILLSLNGKLSFITGHKLDIFKEIDNKLI